MKVSHMATVESELKELEKEAEAIAKAAKESSDRTKTGSEIIENRAQVLVTLEKISKALAELLPAVLGSNPFLTKEASNTFIEKFEERARTYRQEDQTTLGKYLEDTIGKINAFIAHYEAELKKQATQRQKESDFLDMAKQVLARYT